MRTNKWIFPVLALVLAVIAIGAWSYQANNDAEADGDIAANGDVAPAAGEEEAAIPAPEAAAADSVSPHDVQVTVDGGAPSAPRSIGKVDAPVTMVEYSSLTCPHCASAHEHVLPLLIKDYVETGKLRIVFSDFPLNKQALDASKVSRCVANDQYFNFLTLLFSDIDKWAANHPDALITNATLTGLSAERARECLNDKALEDALVKNIQDAVATKGISSTPTFILNDGKKTIAGARPYSEFKAAIDELLAASGQ